MRHRAPRLLAGLLALLGPACAEASGDAHRASDAAQRQVRVTRDVLADADEAARAYGQAHLGHYLKLRGHHVSGRLPSGVSLRVIAGHTGYCVVATNANLPSIHPWRTASTGAATQGPDHSDRCPRLVTSGSDYGYERGT